jgi:FtsZ-binding cell division protein ZapB
MDRLEEGIARATERIRHLHAEGEALREENARLIEELRAIRERLGALERATAGGDNLRRLRTLERQRRELRGRVAELLRIAESLTEEGSSP